MINNVNHITSENPIEQIWKLLRFFEDVPSVSEKIRIIHGIEKGKFEADIKKQAQQIGYCIRQAEEYFYASSKVGLPTRPTLLYYGAVSLSRALILLRKDGNSSLDVLRKEKKHAHHGLEFKRDILNNTQLSETVAKFFSSLQCTCYTKDNNPWGHFSLFYRCLVPCAYIINIEVHDFGKATFLHTDFPQCCVDMLPIETIISKCPDMFELIKSLPDMYSPLTQLGIQPDLCKGNIKEVLVQHLKKTEDGKEQVIKLNTTMDFFLDSVLEEQKKYVLSFYNERNPNIKTIADFSTNMHLRLTFEQLPSEEVNTMYFPDVVDDINGKKYFVIHPETYVPEPASQLVILFCLGMLSRYYPDVWIKTIDKNVQIAELTDSLLNLIYRKFPNLVLDQMTWVKNYVHS